MPGEPTTYEGHLDGTGLRVAIVASRWNDFIVWRLLDGAVDRLVRHGVDRGDVAVAWVPGAWELPLVAAKLAATGRYDAIVTLGAVIRGATGHYDLVAGQAAAGVARVALDTGVPVVFGVLATETIEQAVGAGRHQGRQQGGRGRGHGHRDGRPAAPAARARHPRLSGAPTGPAQGLPRARHPRPVRGGRPGRGPQLVGRLPGDRRRPPHRRGQDPAPPGDPPLRRRGPLRPRHHRARLDRGDGQRRGQPRRAALLQDHHPADPRGAGRGRRRPLAGRARAARRGPGLDRVPGAGRQVPRGARRRRRRAPLLRGHRGQDPRDRRRGGRDHRDGQGAARRRTAHPRHRAHLLHRADRQPGQLRRRDQAPRHGAAQQPPCRAPSSPAPGCWSSSTWPRPTSTGSSGCCRP